MAKRLLYLFLLIRLSLVAITVTHPTGGVLADSGDYIDLSVVLAEEGRYTLPWDLEPELLRPPAYPAVLAALRVALGSETYWITFVNLLMSSATCLIILAIGSQLDRPAAAIAGAWIYALSPNVALWSLTVMSEVFFGLAIALIAWATLKFAKRSKAAWGSSAGILLGLLAYIRPIALMLIPTWSITTFLSSKAFATRRKALIASLVLLLTGLFVVLPWAYRNWRAQELFTFSTVTNKTWIGFNLAHVVARGEGIDRNSAVGLLDLEISTLQLTLNVIRAYPLEFVESQALGLARTAAGTEVGTWGFVLNRDAWSGFGLLGDGSRRSVEQALSDALDWSGPDGGMRFSLNVYSLLFSLVLIGLAAIGIITFRAPDMLERLMFTSAVVSVVILLIIPGAAGQARFRVPAEPYLALLAGYGWLALSARFRRERSSLERLDTQEDLLHAR
ncbi:MAG: ArnT family glycosyltransferase [Anaerolineales bacterium]